MYKKLLYIITALLFCYSLDSFCQDKVTYTYSPISIGVIGGFNISFLPEDTLESNPAAILFGGVNILYSLTRKLHTRLDIIQSTNGKNIISPNTKIRNFYINFLLSEYYSITNFADVGGGIVYALPLYALEKTPNDIKQKTNLQKQINPFIAINLSMNNALDFSVLYSIPLNKKDFNVLQFGFIFWFVNAYNTK